MIFTKQTKQTDTGKQFQVRTLGAEFWVTETEFKKAVEDGQVFFKANKPVTHQDLAKIA